MFMIEISALPNGAHRNQTYNGFLPDGWALIPDNAETENFPFGEVTVEETDGRMVVATWKPLPMPESELSTEKEHTAEELIDIMLGVISDE